MCLSSSTMIQRGTKALNHQDAASTHITVQQGRKRVLYHQDTLLLGVLEESKQILHSSRLDQHHNGQAPPDEREEEPNKKRAFRRRMKRRCSKVGDMFFKNTLPLLMEMELGTLSDRERDNSHSAVSRKDSMMLDESCGSRKKRKVSVSPNAQDAGSDSVVDELTIQQASALEELFA
mmetsp:Transcript_23270/g.34629  ORF Transcript_23270/g.34629 Transcript_23270/m.34629 type:complete len:177 (+) Transcript_23270:99-629(+)